MPTYLCLNITDGLKNARVFPCRLLNFTANIQITKGQKNTNKQSDLKVH